MRAAVLLAATLLTGCGTNAELGSGFVSQVNGFASGLTNQDALEIDLMKDFARKSEELRFISLDTYSCGDPDSKYVEDLEKYYRYDSVRFRQSDYAVLLKARAEVRSKDAILAALASYGDLISDIAKKYKAADETISKASSVISTFKGLSVIPEAAALLGGLQTVLTIAQTIEKYSVETAIRAAALSMSGPLKKTVDALSKKKTLLSLTGPEAKAFSYWDACATERLRFIRDYYPSILAKDANNRAMLLQTHLNGTDRTSVLDFAKEYGVYLAQRETFVGRRPDYLGLLKQIADANTALTTLSGNDLLDTANGVGTMTNTLVKASDDLRKAGF